MNKMKIEKDNLIHDVKLISLPIYQDERGKLLHMIKSEMSAFKGFGEIYFSYTNFGVIKGWYMQKKNFSNFSVLFGGVKLVIFDDRKSSRTFNSVQEINLSLSNYHLVTIPPKVWYSFKTIKGRFSILANLIDKPYRENEVRKNNINCKKFPYKWQ
tara:strand:- start:379 stop:846 length:468 start_codon:yes stop_codon:yes gene_type:complete